MQSSARLMPPSGCGFTSSAALQQCAAASLRRGAEPRVPGSGSPAQPGLGGGRQRGTAHSGSGPQGTSRGLGTGDGHSAQPGTKPSGTNRVSPRSPLQQGLAGGDTLAGDILAGDTRPRGRLLGVQHHSYQGFISVPVRPLPGGSSTAGPGWAPREPRRWRSAHRSGRAGTRLPNEFFAPLMDDPPCYNA